MLCCIIIVRLQSASVLECLVGNVQNLATVWCKNCKVDGCTLVCERLATVLWVEWDIAACWLAVLEAVMRNISGWVYYNFHWFGFNMMKELQCLANVILMILAWWLNSKECPVLQEYMWIKCVTYHEGKFWL